MYEIYADNELIYSDVTPLETVKVVSPKLQLADSAAGQLDMSLPPTNVGYSTIKRMTTDITVKCDGEWLWSGRVLQDAYDFWNNRKIVCEGEIAFLNDSIQPPAKYDVSNDHTTISTFFTALINIHNQQVDANRQFVVGDITVNDGDQQEDNDEINRFTNYESTLECINDKLLSRLGGHLRVRHVFDEELGREVRKLDYIKDSDLQLNYQSIRFGINLLDFSKNIDMSQLSTAIVPRGARLEDESAVEIEGLEPYLTVKNVGVKEETITVDGEPDTEVWHEENSIFVKNPVAVRNFGWICSVVDWDQVTVDENLYTKAAKYLKDEQYEKMVLEVKALDLKYMNYNAESIKFLSKIRCISEPHGMDHVFTVSKVDLDLANPNNNYYTLGDDVQLSLTQATSRANSEIVNAINNMPSKYEILNAAKENAFKMLTGVTGGYVRFNRRTEPIRDEITGEIINDGTKNNVIYEIIISDGPTDDNSLEKWVWNEAGLGHFHRDEYTDDWTKSVYEQSDGTYLDVAITKDGHIVANALTAGVIKGCTLIGEDNKGKLVLEGGDINMTNNETGGPGLFLHKGNTDYSCWGAVKSAALANGSYLEVPTYDIIYVANKLVGQCNTLLNIADYWNNHGGW